MGCTAAHYPRRNVTITLPDSIKSPLSSPSTGFRLQQQVCFSSAAKYLTHVTDRTRLLDCVCHFRFSPTLFGCRRTRPTERGERRRPEGCFPTEPCENIQKGTEGHRPAAELLNARADDTMCTRALMPHGQAATLYQRELTKGENGERCRKTNERERIAMRNIRTPSCPELGCTSTS